MLETDLYDDDYGYDLEFLEDTLEDGAMEKKRAGRPMPRVGQKQLLPPKGGAKPASEAQLNKLAEKVQTEFKKVDAQVAALKRHANAEAARNARQDKALAAMKKEMEQTKQMFLLMSLLSGGKKSYAVENVKTREGADVANSTPVTEGHTLELKEVGDKFDKMLPLLMMGNGLGGNGAQPNGGFDMMSMFVMMQVLGD